jgi:ribosomal protein S6
MGLRDLAYPIKDEVKGYYVVIKISADDAATSEFGRLVKINPLVLRHLIVVARE